MVILGRCLGAKAQVQGGAISGFDIWPSGLPALPHFEAKRRRVCEKISNCTPFQSLDGVSVKRGLCLLQK